MSSLQQFREWAVKNGKVANPDGSYKGQCVSLVQQYLVQVFGIPFRARGNAKDFVPPGFVRVSSLKPGDIIRYGSNYGGGYGHIGLIDDTGAFLDQNGARVLAVNRMSKPFSGINAIFRPTKKFNVKTPKPAPKPKPSITITAPVANVRSEPTTKAKVVATAKKGQKINYIQSVSGQSVNGNKKWYRVKPGRYISATVTNKK